uniref:Putative secreted protein n=1 Tax=Anopheles darlingi TaxID=43151 RepID=A0A2M4DL27_ANODA
MFQRRVWLYVIRCSIIALGMCVCTRAQSIMQISYHYVLEPQAQALLDRCPKRNAREKGVQSMIPVRPVGRSFGRRR